MAGLIPSDEVLKSWTTFTAARTWAGLSLEDWKKVATAVGDPDLDNLMLVAALPPDALREMLSGDKVELSLLAKSKVALAVNAARAAHLQPVVDLLTSKPKELAAGSGSGIEPAPVSANAGLRIKLSQVLDQGSDQEVVQMPASEIIVARRRYKELGGEPPLAKAEVTDAQLSALAFRVREGPAPYADFGVWGPHGARIERRLRFTAYTMAPGGLVKAVEMPGADSLATWRECWAVFRTAAVMLSLALAGVLDRYEAMFVERCERYPNAWHICARADIRCRSEMWVTERWAQEEFHNTHPTMSAFNPAMPWNSVIKASATNNEFWDRELKEPAQNFSFAANPRSDRATAAPSNFGGLPAPPAPPPVNPRPKKKQRTGQPKGQANKAEDARRPDGRYYRDRHGVELCYVWNRADGGCSNGACPNGRAHACEFCRQPHRTVACPKNPGWKPMPKGGGKGGQHY